MAEFDSTRIAEKIWAAMRLEPWFDPLRDNVRAAVDQTVTILAGQVSNIAVKKRVVNRTASLPELTDIVDHLRVAPVHRMADGEIATWVHAALSQEPALADCALRERRIDAPDAPDRDLCIVYSVRSGVVSLEGKVPTLAQKQVAGVLAWWVPGTREVLNRLEETRPEQDTDAELTDIVRRTLQKDPLVDASRVEVCTRHAGVELLGAVATGPERDRAEFDAWYVFGVDSVENHIRIAA